MSGEREARLPKWARDEMERLRRDAQEARREAATARGDNPAHAEQWAWLDRWDSDPIPLSMEPYERIIVTAPGGDPNDRKQTRFSVHGEPDGSLEVMVYHGGSLHVLPRSSNVVRIVAVR